MKNNQLELIQGKKHKPLHQYALEIALDWKNVYFGAKPYLDAMADLDQITDNYGCDSGVSIVLYFLSNARNWRGENAKRIKSELKELTENV